MSEIIFNEAMAHLDGCLSGDRRVLNKSFRVFCAKRFNQKLTVKNADVYLKDYSDIHDSLYQLAVENWHSSEKPDFDEKVFVNYPSIDLRIKKQWIQNAHFKVFR